MKLLILSLVLVVAGCGGGAELDGSDSSATPETASLTNPPSSTDDTSPDSGIGTPVEEDSFAGGGGNTDNPPITNEENDFLNNEDTADDDNGDPDAGENNNVSNEENVSHDQENNSHDQENDEDNNTPGDESDTSADTEEAGNEDPLPPDEDVNSAVVDPETLWLDSTRVAVVNPREFGAAGDGQTDDIEALTAAVAALPEEGGILLFPEGTYLKDQIVWHIDKSHVFLWAPNGRATLHGTVTPPDPADPSVNCRLQNQATVFRRTEGGGVFGLKFTSNGDARRECAESNQIVVDGVNGHDIVGVEIDGSSGTGVFAWRSDHNGDPARNIYIEGNYIHHTHADSIHYTRGSRRSWVWGNIIFNEEPSKGDDGIACVTYSIGSPLCGEMEWWNNRYLGGAHGRGMAVIGGENISIHHNWIIGSTSAGLIVASESFYRTESCANIRLYSNWLLDSPNGMIDNGHSAILISGGNPEAAPIHDVEAIDNVIIGAFKSRVERRQGSYDPDTVTLDNHAENPFLLPGPIPAREDAAPADTAILRTRDTSFVSEHQRRGLYRMHLREGENGLQERFEYIVKGPTASLQAWIEEAANQNLYISEVRAIGDVTFALLLAGAPLTVPENIDPVSFEELRQGDNDGSLSWLWQKADSGNY